MHANIRRALAGAAASAMLAGGAALVIGGSAGPASAVDAPSTTAASVTIQQAMTISDNTPAITFAATAALPDTGQAANIPVLIVVNSNNATGYKVSVAVSSPSPDAGFETNPPTANVIKFSALSVNGNATGAGVYSRFGDTSGMLSGPVDSAPGISATNGDSFSDLYKLDIPNIQPGTYLASLQYTATANS